MLRMHCLLMLLILYLKFTDERIETGIHTDNFFFHSCKRNDEVMNDLVNGAEWRNLDKKIFPLCATRNGEMERLYWK